MTMMVKHNMPLDIRKDKGAKPDRYPSICKKRAEVDSPGIEEALQSTAKNA